MTDRPFELQVVRRGETDYGLALHRRPAAGRSQESNGHWPLVVQTWGTPLRSVMDQVLAVIREAGYRSTDLARTRQAPFALSEAQGVRLAVLFLAVKPLRKGARMAAISGQVQAMTDEEAYYWFSKSTATATARRAQRAMRVLLAEE
jgi:hypothetical protein